MDWGGRGDRGRGCASRKEAQQVRGITQEDQDEPEVLFIGHVETDEVQQAPWQEVKAKGRRDRKNKSMFCSSFSGCSLGDCDCEAPPGLECKGFKVLQEDDPDEEEVEEPVAYTHLSLPAKKKS